MAYTQSIQLKTTLCNAELYFLTRVLVVQQVDAVQCMRVFEARLAPPKTVGGAIEGSVHGSENDRALTIWGRVLQTCDGLC